MRSFCCSIRLLALCPIFAALCAEGAAWAQVVTPPTVEFDAEKKEYVAGGPRGLRHGATVHVKIQNPNTLREKYAIKASATDFHNIGAPGDLAKFILAKAADTGELKAAILKSVDGLPPTFAPRVLALKKQLEKLFDAIDRVNLTLGDLGVLARSARNNLEIRMSLVARIHEVVKGHAVAKAALLSLISKAETTSEIFRSSRHVAEIAEAIENQTEGLAEIRSELDAVVEESRRFVEGLSGHEQEEASQRMSFLVTPNLRNPLTSEALKSVANYDFAKERAAIRFLYEEVLLNPRVFPVTIEASFPVRRADEVEIAIQVDQAPAAFLLGTADKESAARLPALDAGIGSKTFKKSLPVYGRWVLDFGGGAIASTLGENRYFKDAGNIVRQGPSDRTLYGFGVLAHIYETRPGIAFGPAIGVASTSPVRYLLGIASTVTVGGTRLSVSYGASYGEQTTLNGDVLGSAAIGQTVSTSKQFRSKPFLAFTASFALK